MLYLAIKWPTWQPCCRKVVCVDTEADFTSSAKRFDRDLAEAVKAKKGEKTDEDGDRKGPVTYDAKPVDSTYPPALL